MSAIPTPIPALDQDQDQILTRAVLSAAEGWRLSGRDLAAILGVSEARVSRCRNAKGSPLAADSKAGELGLMMLRVFRSLDALVGGDEEQSSRWLRSDNEHLRGVPLERMKTVEGLVDVAGYLDAMRGV